MAEYDAETGEVAAELVDLRGVANGILPRIAEVFGESNQLVSQAGESEDADFLDYNGEEDDLKGFFSQARKDIVDILKANNERVYAHAGVLKKVIEDFREDDELNSKGIDEAYGDKRDDQERNTEERLKDGKEAPYREPDITHVPIGSDDEITDPSDRPPQERW